MPIESQYRTLPLTKAQGKICPAFSLWLVIAIAGLIVGCGSGSVSTQPSPTPTPTPPPPTPTPAPATLFLTPGNWQIHGTSATSVSIGVNGAGEVSQSGNSVTGLEVTIDDPSECFGPVNREQLTGIMSGSTLTLITSVPAGTLTIVLTGNEKQLTGTYQITGPCLNLEHGTMEGVFVPSITGTWAGALTSTTGAVTQITVTVTQGPLSTTGFKSYPLSGTVAFTGTPCIASGIFVGVDSFIIGASVALQEINDRSGPFERQVNIFTVVDAPGGATMSGNYNASQGGCPSESGTVLLTRQ